LTDSTRKEFPNKLPWFDNHQQAFDTLKQLLRDAVVNPLLVVDFNSPFNLSVDASNFSVSGIVSQTDDKGHEKPIALSSQKLTDTQSKSWSTIEKEAYAAIFALTKYRTWLFGAPKIDVYSDHNPLQFLTMSAPNSSKLTRWSFALQEFNIEFHYKPGKLNFPANFLSRL
jgi:hypothetical protein